MLWGSHSGFEPLEAFGAWLCQTPWNSLVDQPYPHQPQTPQRGPRWKPGSILCALHVSEEVQHTRRSKKKRGKTSKIDLPDQNEIQLSFLIPFQLENGTAVKKFFVFPLLPNHKPFYYPEDILGDSSKTLFVAFKSRLSRTETSFQDCR